ncbi:non-ribosomal peptide synthetase [Pantoea rodasii]|uniref:non-ribosomal peptide synthetase n=1 Tax=Pantoea rodasii TaxID=1076549 RepID=UPI0006915DAC|nr:non-ribosomal peptide synthetase [Pantoea rodasii]
MRSLTTQLIEHTAALMGVSSEEIDHHHSLLLQGVDSIGLMRTVNLLRKQGVTCHFETLKQQPTLHAWLALLAQETPAKPATACPLPDSPMDKPIALTPVQQAYWMGRQEEQPLGGNSCQVYVELQGADICPQRLSEACQQLVQRHAMLRAQFTHQGEQWVSPVPREFKLEVDDLRQLSTHQVEARLLEHRQQFSHYRADIFSGWPMRIALSRLPGQISRLHLNIDLLVADVLSITLLLRDLAAFYQHGAAALAPLSSDFFQYQRLQQRENSDRRCLAQKYWQQRLPTLPGGPTLPLAQSPEMLRKPHFTRREYLLKKHSLALLESKAKQQGITLATLFLTLYCEVIAHWSENKHFLINVPLFNRQEWVPDASHIVADFTSLLLLEVDFRSTATFTQRLQNIQAQLHRDISHSDYSGVDVLRDMARAESAAPRTAPVVFALNLGEFFIPPEAEQAFGQLHWMISQTPQVWIDHQSYPTQEGLLLNWDSVDDLFPAGMVATLFSSWLARLHLLIEQSWDALPAIGLPPETHALRSRINATTQSLPRARLHDGFFEQAICQPDAPAVMTADRRISYQALAQRALEIAHALQQQGVNPQDCVAINLSKGIDQIAAVLAVLAAGACWLPLAIGHPLGRRARICERASVACVITQQTEPWPETVTAFYLDEVSQSTSAARLSAPVAFPDSHLAYVIYTSGSTGEPKGVAVSHQAAWNTLASLNHRFSIDQDDRVLALSGLEFDLSVYDIFGVLSAGGALVMPEEDQRRDPDAWRTLAQQHKVTLWNSVPALMEMLLLTSSEQPLLPDLRLVWLSGDWVAPDLAQRIRQRLSQPLRVVAMGGATEAAIWSNAFEILPDYDTSSRVPYGYPLSNQTFTVMDEHGCACPDWVPGELWIGGAGLAQEYYGDARQTAERFVTHQGQRWYRTGDRGYYSNTGLLHFLGRQDHQIKLDGHRIELAEIEAILCQLPGISAAQCFVVHQHLEAVVITPEAVDISTLTAQLALQLPPYMLPKRIVARAQVPLTSNGKIDRAELQRWLASVNRADPVPSDANAESPLVAQLRPLWLEMLALTSLSAEMTFFQAGGNSLQAMRLVNRINQTLGMQLSLRQFLNNASLAALARFIEATCPAVTTSEEGAL